MPFLLLLVLTLICLQHVWPQPPAWLGGPGSVAVTWSMVLVSALIATRFTRSFCSLVRSDTVSRSEVSRRYAKYRRFHFNGQLVGFFVAAGLLGWGWTAKSFWSVDGVPLPGFEVFVLLPLLASLTLAWSRHYDLERALHKSSYPTDAAPFPGRWSYVASQVRHNLILIVPPLFLLLIQQTVLWLAPSLRHDELLLPLFGVGLLCFVFVAIPWLLRLLLGLKPLPAGLLRDRLMATAQRVSFRFSDILVWSTRNSVANAMVTGPMPFLRYVILTDRLIEDMSADEIESVFGHEIGHVKHYHMLFYFGFLLASLLVTVVLWKATTDLLAVDAVQTWLVDMFPNFADWQLTYQFAAQVLLVALLGAYIFVVFGFLSRRCERQADVYGCRTSSCQTFIDTLEKVARLNGISRDRPGWLSSWQHSTIAKRVAFLERMSIDPELEPRFQRRVEYVKLGAIVALGAALVVLGFLLGPDHVWASLKQL